MKKIILALSMLSFSVIHSQDMSYFSKSMIDKGDKEYSKFAYQSAVEYYLKAHKKDDGNNLLISKIADCYRLLNDQTKAEVWYEELVGKEQNQPDHYLYYAQALESNRKYEKAQLWYQKYAEAEPLENRAGRKLEGLDKVDSYYYDSGYYQIVPVKINSNTPDFSATYYKNGIVFVSGRKKSPIVKKVFNWDESSYLDLYFAEIDEKHHLSPAKQFNKRINTRYHEGPLAFYEDETRVVFTRSNFYEGKEERSKDDINKLKVFFATNENGSWSDIEPFQYNDNEYSVGHPTILNNGSLMIFASDMPGSLGGTDLWYAEKAAQGWTTPQNLGPQVNTEGNEMFPFLDGETLYFSSNGQAGLGGLDIYKVEFNRSGQIGNIMNLGAPVNSSKDDFGLITNDDGYSGYFSSNRIHELYDDLFHFSFDKPRTTKIKGIVELQKDLSPIENAQVFLVDALSNDTLETVNTDRKGRFLFDANWDKKYRLVASKPEYKSLDIPVVDTHNHVEEEVVMLMNKMELVARVIAIDEVTKELIPMPHIIAIDPHTGESLTPRQIDVDTFEYIVKPGITYDVAGAKRHYFTEHTNQFSGTEKYGEVFWIVPLGEIELDKAIALEKIYYDLNKANIRPDAAIELDKLVKILEENPHIKIELSSHTDARGSDSYNKSLSQRRAESAVNYLIDHGIASDRVEAKGYGEERLVNDCSNGVQCTKDEHQRNRRTEFKVTEY